MTKPADALAALASLFPITAEADAAGHLRIGGCAVPALVAAYGSPLYIYDEATLRAACQGFRHEFETRLPGVQVHFAAKAYLSPALATILADEGLGMDIVSGGELFVAGAAGFPMERVAFHGNNKSAQELRDALDAGVGRIVVDNLHELALLEEVAGERGQRQPVLLRLSPGIDAHTHAKTTTGVLDSKFGLPIRTGAAEEAVRRALATPTLELTGIHIHLGSPIHDTEPYVLGIAAVAEFAAQMQERYGFEWREFSPGGGFAVAYRPDVPQPSLAAYAEAIAEALQSACAQHGLPMPDVRIEPGRAIVARAGVAVYTVGARKEIPSVRTYISVDGGMADNIRPTLYGSRYSVVAADRLHDAAEETVTVVGKFCESGDTLVKDVSLPHLRPGDLLAIPASGAYQLSMESNYNMATRPAVLFVRDGQARLTRRRQALADLLTLEVLPAEAQL